MVNPGEMHDGSSLDGTPRDWRMLYFESEVAFGCLAEEERYRTVALRPDVRDRHQFIRFGRLFGAVTDPQPDGLHIEEGLVTTLGYAFRHHGSRRPMRLSNLF